GSTNSGFSNESDIVSEKSSIGEISSKISVRPDFRETSSPPAMRASTTLRHFSLPTSQSKLSVWSARSWGTSSGSEIFAKEIRRGLLLAALLRAAKRVSFYRFRSGDWRHSPQTRPPGRQEAFESRRKEGA